MLRLSSLKLVTCKRRQQTGDALLDALIAMLLAMVVGLGPAYVASRGAVVQRQASYKNLAVVQLRNLLAAQGPDLCDTPTTPTITVSTTVSPSVSVMSLPVTVSCTTRAATGITIGGQALDPTGTHSAKTVSLSVTSQALFGGSGTIAISQAST